MPPRLFHGACHGGNPPDERRARPRGGFVTNLAPGGSQVGREQLRKDMLSGSMWGLAGQGASLATSLVLTPFIIRSLGPDAYGALVFVGLATNCIVFTDLGMGIASTRLGAAAASLGDGKREVQVFWSALGLIAFSTVASAALLAWFAQPISSHFVDGTPTLLHATAFGLQLSCVAFWLRGLAGVTNTPQLARFRFRSYTLVHYGAAVSQTVLTVVVLGLGGGLVSATGVAAGMAGVTFGVHFLLAMQLQPEVRHPCVASTAVRDLLRVGLPSALSSLIGNALFFGERLLVAAFLSPRDLAFYSVAISLAQLIEVVPTALGYPLVPAFAHLQATAQYASMNSLRSGATRLVLLLVSPFPLACYLGGRSVLSLWAGPEYAAAGAIPLVALSLGACANALALTPRSLLQACGRTDIVARIHSLLLAPYALGAFYLVVSAGVTGAAIAWSVRSMAECVMVTVRARKLYQVEVHAGSGFGPVWAVIALLCCAGWLTGPDQPLVIVLTAFPLAACAYLGLAWRVLLSPRERDWIKAVVSHLRTLR